MTYIIDSPKLAKIISVNHEKNAEIKSMHRKLVALSFSKGNNSQEYQDTLTLIRQLRQS